MAMPRKKNDADKNSLALDDEKNLDDEFNEKMDMGIYKSEPPTPINLNDRNFLK